MKLSRLFAASTLLVLAAAAGATALRQGPTAPSEEHRWLKSHVGMWDAKISGMLGESKGTWEVKAGPGDLWTVGEFKGDMMGMPFHGMEFLGYDPDAKQYTSVWIDSMTPRPMPTTGTYDKASKTLTMKGESMGPDGKMAPMTNVSHYTDADHITFTMSGPGPDGKDMEMMKIEYTRRK